LGPTTILVNNAAFTAPGLSYYAREFDEVATAEKFAQAAVELALVDAGAVTGRTIGRLQVLDGSYTSA
jgi:7-alpha-hydroxysteroid dehydrogenase